ncbi:MATE family efflux transporter [Holdemania massiliensis]
MSKKLDKEFLKIFFRLSIPVIISEVVLLIANNASTAMLGTLSEKAISGFSVSNQAFDIYSMVILGLTGGFHVYIAQYYGSQNQEKYNQVLRYGLKLALAVGFFCTAAFLFFADPFSRLFLKDPETLAYAIPYLRIFSLTFIPYAVNLVVSGAYSIIGKARITLYAGALNCGVNLLFCYLLVYGVGFFPQMGSEGAALSLVIARLAETVFLYFVVNRKNSEFRFRLKYPPLKENELMRILRTSAPLIMNECLFAFAFMIVFMNYSYVGEQYLACIPVVTLITKLVFVPSTGAGSVIGVMVGGQLGRGRLEEARENMQKIRKTCYLIIILGCTLIALCSPWIPKLFSLQGDVYEMAVKMLLVKAFCSALGGGITMVFYNTLRIGGDTRSVFFLDGFFSCCFPMLLSLLFSRVLPVSFLGLYFAVEFCNVIKSLLGSFFVKKEKWLQQLS